jgi:hypothetical protein
VRIARSSVVFSRSASMDTARSVVRAIPRVYEPAVDTLPG